MLHVSMLSDIDVKNWFRRAVFLLHFHRLSVGCLLLFRRQRFLIARALVHEGPVVGTELLSGHGMLAEEESG